MPLLASTGPSIVQAPLFVVLFLWLAAVIGQRVLRLLGASADAGVVALVAGAGVLQLLPLALGAAGVLGPRSLRWGTVAVALAASPDLLVVAREAARRWRQWYPSRWLVAWGAAIALGLVGVALLALTPTLDPDGLSYHLTVPKRWLASGTLHYLPTYVPSNSPMGFEMLFGVAMVFAGDSAAKLLGLVVAVIGALGLVEAGRLLRAPVAGALAATLFLFGPTGVGLFLGFAYVEGPTAFALIGSAVAWLRWLRARQPGWLRAAALLAGVGVSFKLTAALFAMSLGVLTIFVIREQRRQTDRPPQVPRLWELLALAIAPTAPWLLRSAILTGNPGFPLFAHVIPTRDLSPALSIQYQALSRYLSWGSSIGESLSIERRHAIISAATAGLLVIGGVVFLRLRSRLARAVALVATMTAVVQLLTVGLYIRYWVPLLSVMVLAILRPFEAWLSRRSLRAGVVVMTAVAGLVLDRKSVRFIDGDVAGLVRTAAGIEPQRLFLEQHFPMMALFEQVNATLPHDSRVLLSCDCPGFYLDRTTYCAEFPTGAMRFASWPEFVSDLRRLGVTHVLAPLSLAAGGPYPPLPLTFSRITRADEYVAMTRLLQRHARLLGSVVDQGLYAIDTDALAR